MLNEMIVVTVTPFSGTSTADKNGEFPVMLQLIAGRMPNRQVLSGTVAKRQGIEVGETYLMQVRERGFDKVFGPDYNFTRVKKLETGKDIIEASKELCEPFVVEVPRPEGFVDEYTRKGDAVEGLRTKRIQEGNYIPVGLHSSTDHSTARKVVGGTSVDSESANSENLGEV